MQVSNYVIFEDIQFSQSQEKMHQSSATKLVTSEYSSIMISLFQDLSSSSGAGYSRVESEDMPPRTGSMHNRVGCLPGSEQGLVWGRFTFSIQFDLYEKKVRW